MFKFLITLSVLSVFGIQELSAKIRFLSFQFNRPDFLEIQCKLLEKFILDDYEIIVFNDAKDFDSEKSIRDVCQKNNIQYIRFEQDWHELDPLNEYIKTSLEDPRNSSELGFGLTNGPLTTKIISQQGSIRHCHVIQYAMSHFGYNHDDIVVLLDHDLFPIKPISIRALLTEQQLIGIDSESLQEIHYLWVPFIAFDPKRLPNLEDLKFHCDIINNVLYDSGSHSYHYLKNNPNVDCKMYRRAYDKEFYYLTIQELKALGFSREEIQLIKSLPWPGCIEFYVDRHFIHYGSGSWDFHPIKQGAVFNFLNKVLKNINN